MTTLSLAPLATTRPSRRAWRAVLRTEARLFARDPIGVVWGVALPVVAFVVLGCLTPLRRADPSLHGGTFLQVYQSVLPLFGAAMIALTALPPVLGHYREHGVLRRYAVTPMSPVRVLGAQLTIHLTAALCTGIVVLAVGTVAFDTGPGVLAWAWLSALALGVLALLGLGLVVAAVAPTAKIAGAVGTILFFPLMFGAGLWVPRATMPAVMRTICDWTPLGAANRAMSATLAGELPSWAALLALAAYAVGLWSVAVRSFRWA